MEQVKPSGPLGPTTPICRPRLQGPAPAAVMAPQPPVRVMIIRPVCKCGQKRTRSIQ